MSTYPTSPRSAFLEWCEAHKETFISNATAIGLTAAQATAFADDTDAASGANLSQSKAKDALMVATQTVDAALATLRTRAGDTVRTIRAFAEQSSDPLEVYNTAEISAPKPATPAPPPAQPTNLTVTLDPTEGTVTLRWKAANPTGTSGTAYIIKRKLPGESSFNFIGVSGTKEFVDTTLAAGPDWVQYTVQGQRADVPGPVSPVFTVNFGQAPDGIATATVSTGGGYVSAGTGGINAADAALVEAIVNSKGNTNGRKTAISRKR